MGFQPCTGPNRPKSTEHAYRTEMVSRNGSISAMFRLALLGEVNLSGVLPALGRDTHMLTTIHENPGQPDVKVDVGQLITTPIVHAGGSAGLT